MATPQDEVAWETRSNQVGLMFTTFATVWMPSINNTMSAHRWKVWKEGVEGHGFVHMKHETLCLSQWRLKHLKMHHVMQSIPHHWNNEEGELLDLRANHKCNGSPQKLTDGGGPT
jgi:hypothetical protein